LKPSTLTSEEKKNVIVAAADDKKANYITEIDLRGKTIIADFFIICTGTSNIHIRAVADGIIEGMEKQGIRQNRIEGYNEANWVLLDYGDVIVHIMSEDQRHYYKLEALWAGQPTPGRQEDADDLDTVDEGDLQPLEDEDEASDEDVEGNEDALAA
jgi:ribosome-associated protein